MLITMIECLATSVAESYRTPWRLTVFSDRDVYGELRSQDHPRQVTLGLSAVGVAVGYTRATAKLEWVPEVRG